MEGLRIISKILANPLVVVIMVYQKTFSPDHGLLKIYYPDGFCRFHPSCSMYALEILRRDGLLGMHKIIYRLVPFSVGGVDLP